MGPLEKITDKKDTYSFCATSVSAFKAQRPWMTLDSGRTFELLHADRDDTNIWLCSYTFIRDN